MKFSSRLLSVLLLMATVSSSVNAMMKSNPNPNNNLQQPPEGKWMTLQDGTEILIPDTTNPYVLEAQSRMLKATSLERSYERYTYYNKMVDSSETYYAEYAQAYRLVGFYIDCNVGEHYYSDDERRRRNRHRRGRKLQEEDQEQEQGRRLDDYDYFYNFHEYPCERYLLWAAYVDLGYEGNGLGEYQYYDRHEEVWDDSYCGTTGGDRCVKMDCHNLDTHYSLIGFYKQPNFGQWMEQLFKHAGVCLWDDSEYAFMQGNRVFWPTGCTEVDYQPTGETLYFDVKPMPDARITIGLYDDWRCQYDYEGKTDVSDVLDYYRKNYDGEQDNYYCDGDGECQYCDENTGECVNVGQDVLIDQMEEWNNAFDVFKYCQPCKAYKLSYNQFDDSEREHQQDEDDENGGNYVCNDDAGYTNVNQCMKFATHTNFRTANFRDVLKGAEQGTITTVISHQTNNVYGNTFTTQTVSRGYMIGCGVVFFLGIVMFYLSRKFIRLLQIKSSNLNEPLMDDDDKSSAVSATSGSSPTQKKKTKFFKSKKEKKRAEIEKEEQEPEVTEPSIAVTEGDVERFEDEPQPPQQSEEPRVNITVTTSDVGNCDDASC